MLQSQCVNDSQLKALITPSTKHHYQSNKGCRQTSDMTFRSNDWFVDSTGNSLFCHCHPNNYPHNLYHICAWVFLSVCVCVCTCVCVRAHLWPDSLEKRRADMRCCEALPCDVPWHLLLSNTLAHTHTLPHTHIHTRTHTPSSLYPVSCTGSKNPWWKIPWKKKTCQPLRTYSDGGVDRWRWRRGKASQ